jgi:manganese-dependent ADP-ribose/CDP-alcohol diphosphatase
MRCADFLQMSVRTTGVLAPIALLIATVLAGLGCNSTAASADSNTLEMSTSSDLPFSFGLLSDVQYADKETVGKRRYRDGLVNLKNCVKDFRSKDLRFVVHCGDIIDGRDEVEESRKDLNQVVDAFSRLTCEVHHVIGNHCLEVPRAELEKQLGLKQNYYSFIHSRWRFINVDSMAFSIGGLDESDPAYLKAKDWLDQHKSDAYPSARAWNGGLGEQQREWLKLELASAEQAGQKVVVFSHHPVLAESSTKGHLLWDHAEVLAILDQAPAFTAWINGHDHAGGFAERNGRSFLTLPAVVNADPANNAYATVDVFVDRMEIHGVGNVASRTIRVAAQ